MKKGRCNPLSETGRAIGPNCKPRWIGPGPRDMPDRFREPGRAMDDEFFTGPSCASQKGDGGGDPPWLAPPWPGASAKPAPNSRRTHPPGKGNRRPGGRGPRTRGCGDLFLGGACLPLFANNSSWTAEVVLFLAPASRPPFFFFGFRPSLVIIVYSSSSPSPPSLALAALVLTIALPFSVLPRLVWWSSRETQGARRLPQALPSPDGLAVR